MSRRNEGSYDVPRREVRELCEYTLLIGSVTEAVSAGGSVCEYNMTVSPPTGGVEYRSIKCEKELEKKKKRSRRKAFQRSRLEAEANCRFGGGSFRDKLLRLWLFVPETLTAPHPFKQKPPNKWGEKQRK